MDKFFKIGEDVCMKAGEDALYIEKDGYIHRYAPSFPCYVFEHEDGTCICSECRGILWDVRYAIDNMHNMPKYCKWCGAKILEL